MAKDTVKNTTSTATATPAPRKKRQPAQMVSEFAAQIVENKRAMDTARKANKAAALMLKMDESALCAIQQWVANRLLEMAKAKITTPEPNEPITQ